MQFQVPQFIEVEDKIFGPLTFRQFIWIGGGAGACYLLYRLLPFFFAIPLVVGVGGFAVALAFFKFNDRPFIVAVENAFYYVIHPRLYLWNNEQKSKKRVAKQVAQGTIAPEVYIPKLSNSKLHELAWSLDIKERIAAGSADTEDRARYDAMRQIKTAKDAFI